MDENECKVQYKDMFQLFCLQPETSHIMGYIGVVVALLIQILMVFLFRKANKIIEKMTKPSPFVVDHDETFCIFSLRIIQLV